MSCALWGVHWHRVRNEAFLDDCIAHSSQPIAHSP